MFVKIFNGPSLVTTDYIALQVEKIPGLRVPGIGAVFHG